VSGIGIKGINVAVGAVLDMAKSGKVKIVRNAGAFECSIVHEQRPEVTDFELIETLFAIRDGFLVWLSSGDTEQFRLKGRIGYRFQDLFLMDLTNEYEPTYVDGKNWSGIPINLELKEVV